MRWANWSRGWLIGLIALGLTLTCCWGRVGSSAALPPLADASLVLTMEVPAVRRSDLQTDDQPVEALPSPSEVLWYQAVEQATRAANLAQTALLADDWNQVVMAWIEAITRLQAIPVDDPRRSFTQRKVRDYLQNLQVAQQQAERQSSRAIFPSLGSVILDEQVSLYRSYVATLGSPDVLVIGSSRALQGVDPQVLQQVLAQRGWSQPRVYNFSVNGATAQVVSFMLRQLLPPAFYPKLVIWAGGSRAFNSGRYDRTFAEILASPGYATVLSGQSLTLDAMPVDAPRSDPAADISLSISAIDAHGFLPVENRFDPASYYHSYPKVAGAYDDAYRPFRLDGVQAVSFAAITQFLQSQEIPLVFVNLPLSDDYLDSVRLPYERQFQEFLQRQAKARAFILIDWLEQGRNADQMFADPSHLNRFGAAEMARRLATDSRPPWAQIRSLD